VQKITRLLIAAFFASIMFVTRFFVPVPFDRLLIAVDAVLLALSALFVKTFGATYVGALGGVLVGLLLPSFLPFSIIFMFLYGIIVDGFIFLLRVDASEQGVNRNRLIIAMALGTLLIAVVSYYATTVLGLIPSYPFIDMLVLFMGPASGISAGYAAAYLWNKYLRTMTVSK
jgi:hypothetical protein